MANDKFTVASIGFDERDQNVLLTMLALAKNRIPSFVLFEAGGAKKTADILIVDADKPDAVMRWNAYLKANQNAATISTILACQDLPPSNPNDKNRYIKKPFSATLLLSMLEDVVITQHGHVPPQLFTGDNGKADVSPGDDQGQVEELTGKIAALVVDDSLPVRIQMKKALHNVAGRVDFAETGEEAEHLIRENNYDIVFLDVILPGVDGYDICKLIKKNPQKSKTPVIMLTSNSSPADRIKGKMSGCDTYLIKPVRHDVFREVIHEFLNLEV